MTLGSNLLMSDSSSTVGNILLNSTRFLHNYSSNGTKSNVFVGPGAGNYTNSGYGNSCLGSGTGTAISTGFNNLCLGTQAGSTLTTGSNCVLIANTGASSSDTNVIRIGNGTHTGAQLYGVYGVTTSGGIAVYANSSGVLGTATSSKKFKNTINDIIDDKTNKLHNLEVKSFYYNDDVDKKYLQYGLIAEDVAKIYPKLICKAVTFQKDEDGRDKVKKYKILRIQSSRS